MLEAAGGQAIARLGEQALSKTNEIRLQSEMARQMAQQEAFRVGELSAAEITDFKAIKERESDAVDEIHNALEQSPAEDSQQATPSLEHDVNHIDSVDTRLDQDKTEVGMSEAEATTEESGAVQGGAYKDIESKDGYEKHHMPADSTTPLDYEEGPCIRMEKADHRQTASCGSSNEAREYRATQKELIEQGKYQEAFQMDVDDIRSKYGDKYDEAIAQAETYLGQLQEKGAIS